MVTLLVFRFYELLLSAILGLNSFLILNLDLFGLYKVKYEEQYAGKCDETRHGEHRDEQSILEVQIFFLKVQLLGLLDGIEPGHIVGSISDALLDILKVLIHLNLVLNDHIRIVHIAHAES